MSEMNIKPLKLLPSAAIFVSASILLGVVTRWCIPFFSAVSGVEPIVFWFVLGGLGVFIPLIIVGIIMLGREGYSFSRKTFTGRLRFRTMTRRDWGYSLVGLTVIGILTAGIMVLMQAFVPNFDHTPSFMTLEPLSFGRYWLLLLWLPYWLLNIGGEEFFLAGSPFTTPRAGFRKKSMDIARYGLGCLSSCVWLAVVGYVASFAVCGILRGSKNEEHLDGSIFARRCQWTELYCDSMWVDIIKIKY